MRSCLISILLLPTSLIGCAPSSSGDAHGELEPISVTVFTPQVELFMEYPPLVQGQSARFLAHLSVLENGEPIRAGTFTLEARPAGGAPVIAKLDAPKREGLYMPEMIFPGAGEYDANIVIDGPQVSGSVPVGKIVVHPDEATMMKAAAAKTEPEPANAVPFLMEQQWKIGMLLSTVGKHTLVDRLRCSGEIMAPAGAWVVASSPIAGRLIPPSGGKIPRLGDAVQAGQTLARVEPPLPALTDVAVRSLALQTSALEIERALRDAGVKLDYAKRAVERQTSLRKEGVVSERQFDEARSNLEVAESEHASAAAMKLKYEAAAKDLALLQEAARTVSTDAEAGDLLRVRIQSPIAGHIATADRTEGEHVEAHEAVFRVINLDSVWIVARVSEFDLSRIPKQPNAVLAPQAYPDQRIDVFASGGRLVHFGSVVDPASRTVTLNYELPNRDGLFRAGMLADVYLQTQEVAEAVAIPEAAVVMEGGRPIAFALLEGETFQKRELTLGIRDNGFVEVREGLSAGERVVTRGTYALKLSSLSGGFGPGHVH